MKQTKIRFIRSLLLASDGVSAAVPLGPRDETVSHPCRPGEPYLQESGAGAPLGKLNVAPAVMSRHCITMVSPTYPPTADNASSAARVIVRVVIWKSGNVTPLRAVSGPQRAPGRSDEHGSALAV